mmetsp:Transcript_114365/g.180024  ORF Transcript_114365/g.180024 Transcript_114365/m.180024 type:complete len:280 (+) Transcript_114365:407-1246(+)
MQSIGKRRTLIRIKCLQERYARQEAIVQLAFLRSRIADNMIERFAIQRPEHCIILSLHRRSSRAIVEKGKLTESITSHTFFHDLLLSSEQLQAFDLAFLDHVHAITIVTLLNNSSRRGHHFLQHCIDDFVHLCLVQCGEEERLLQNGKYTYFLLLSLLINRGCEVFGLIPCSISLRGDRRAWPFIQVRSWRWWKISILYIVLLIFLIFVIFFSLLGFCSSFRVQLGLQLANFCLQSFDFASKLLRLSTIQCCGSLRLLRQPLNHKWHWIVWSLKQNLRD